MRTQKLESVWCEFYLPSRAEKSVLDGAFLISKWGQIDRENVPSLRKINRSIDKITERVTELVSACSLKSPSRTIAFIQHVLYDEMGFQGVAGEDQTLDDFFIDKVT